MEREREIDREKEREVLQYSFCFDSYLHFFFFFFFFPHVIRLVCMWLRSYYPLGDRSNCSKSTVSSNLAAANVVVQAICAAHEGRFNCSSENVIETCVIGRSG
jgi:hypothetical protein